MGYCSIGMTQTGSAAYSRIDDTTGALSTIGQEHYEIHGGTAFSYVVTASAATTASGAIAFLTGTASSHFRIVGISCSKDQLFINLYGGDSASGITGSGGWSASALSVARNRNTSTTGNIRWMTTASGAVLSPSATLLDAHYIGGGSSVGGNKSGGTAAADEEWVLKPNWVYMLHWVNNSSATNVFNIRTFHYDE